MAEQLKYLIAIPCGTSIPTPTVAALTYMNRVGLSRVTFLQDSMVYEARHKLIAEALATGVDRILFIDSDMVFNGHLMEQLAADMDEGRDIVCGLYFKRVFPTKPILYKTIAFKGDEDCSVLYEDYPKDSIFEVDGCGFGAVMISQRVLEDVTNYYGYPFAPMVGKFGEDLSFCWRAKQLGYRLWCDSRIKVGHVGQFVFGEETYKAQMETQKGGAE